MHTANTHYIVNVAFLDSCHFGAIYEATICRITNDTMSFYSSKGPTTAMALRGAVRQVRAERRQRELAKELGVEPALVASCFQSQSRIPQ